MIMRVGPYSEMAGDFIRKRTKKKITISSLYVDTVRRSVQFSHSVMSNYLKPHELQHTRLPCPSPTPEVHSDSHPSSQ